MNAIPRDELVDYLAGFLAVDRFKDACTNGLQVEGAGMVAKIAVSVSASEELFLRAAEAGAQMVVVHHGLFWDGPRPVIRGALRKRLRPLLDRDLSLLAYHLPLDVHPEIGNNILAARGLELTGIRPFGDYHGVKIGFAGRFPAPLPAQAFFERIERLFGRKPLIFPHGPEAVETVGIVSGGAQSEIQDAASEGLDAYVTGEAAEFVVRLALEEGVHYLAAGHYATERPGIRALGDHLAEKFGIEVEYIDLPVPV